MHISPGTVAFLRHLGHDVVRVNEVMAATSPDQDIIAYGARNDRAIFDAGSGLLGIDRVERSGTSVDHYLAPGIIPDRARESHP